MTVSPDGIISAQDDSTSKAPTALRMVNYLNLGAFAVNALTTTLSGFAVFGPDNTALSKKYTLLITPAGFAFAIWGPIFLWEAAFSVLQMLPRYRSNKLVDLVTPGFVGACIAQSCWNVAFAQESMVVALIFMLGILAGLMSTIINTDGVAMTWEEFFCLRGMFSLHGGWIVAAAILNASVVFDAARASPEDLLGLAIASIGGLCSVATVFALVKRTPDPIVPSVAAWALNAISVKLGDPTDLNNPNRHNPHMWSKETLGGLQVATTLTAYLAALLAAMAVFRSIWQQTHGSAAHDDLKAGLAAPMA